MNVVIHEGIIYSLKYLRFVIFKQNVVMSYVHVRSLRKLGERNSMNFAQDILNELYTQTTKYCNVCTTGKLQLFENPWGTVNTSFS